MRVLIVDDTASARIFMISLLKRLGVDDIVQAENGSQALTILREDKKFDMIFMDWKMPVMTGPEAISVLKYKGNRIPIILTTAKNSTEDVDQVLKLGISDYLLKPFNINFLADKIYHATGKEVTY